MYSDQRQSLVERKKLQWAREREELAELNAVWGRDSQLMRLRNVTKIQNHDEIERRVSRRQSLPPLYKNHVSAFTSNEKLDKEMGGETSGYGSDNVNNSPEHCKNRDWNNSLGYESSSSTREDRLKWGDRGVHVGKFWEPKTIDNFSKNNDTPGWVKRGLEGNTELVVSNTSPAESPEQEYIDRERPSTSSTNSQMRCYIRGQNVPIEPTELAEREKRRQLALAHQEAIRQQLEERERKKKEDKERRMKEEYEEEVRIKKEKDIEKQRKDKEEQLIREKLERERKRKEALQEAIEIAEKQARQDRRKLKLLKQNNVNMKENLIEKDNIKSPRQIENNIKENNILKREDCGKDEIEVPIRLQNLMDNEYIINSNHNNKDPDNKNFIKSKNEFINNDNLKKSSIEETTYSANNKTNSKVPIPQLQLPLTTAPSENLALVFQTPFETFQNMQYAVLMPTSGNGTPTALPIAVPITVTTDRSSTSRTENKVLTPSQYRNKHFCDSSTQTYLSELNKNVENNNHDKYLREKLSNLEINYDIRSQKERRTRNDDRARESMEERPKWGVNRPPTRYLKQSEKDLVYQRRKQRQKLRQVKNCDDKTHNYSPHSSDDSQTASPRLYRKNSYPEKRHGRALWRKNNHIFSQNVRVYQTEIVPLEVDKDHIYYKRKSCNQCCCTCCDEKDHIKVVDILKIQRHSPTDCPLYDNENLKDQLNTNSMDSSSEIYDKIQNDLFVKQDQWEN